MEIIALFLAVLGLVVLIDTIKVYAESCRNEVLFLKSKGLVQPQNINPEIQKIVWSLSLVRELEDFNVKLAGVPNRRPAISMASVESDALRQIFVSVHNASVRVEKRPIPAVKQSSKMFLQLDKQFARI